MTRSEDSMWAVVVLVCLGAADAMSMAQKPTMAGIGAGATRSMVQTGLQTGSHPTSGSVPASASGSQPLGAGSFDTVPSPFPDNGRIKRNDDRQRRLVSDTEKLVALTNLLKLEVASSGAETMSPVMLKQMEEIEKLAKSVKDKMRD